MEVEGGSMREVRVVLNHPVGDVKDMRLGGWEGD
jgi:hypothetical protein